MSPELIAIIIVGLSNAASLGFLWTLHHDVAGLRERITRLEERFLRVEERLTRLEQGFAKLEQRLTRLGGLFERFAGRVRGTGETGTGT